MNEHGVSLWWFTSGALKAITNIGQKDYTFYGKLKNRIPSQIISQILFIDAQQFSKMWISLQVFFKGSVDGFRTTYLKKWISVKVFFKKFLRNYYWAWKRLISY